MARADSFLPVVDTTIARDRRKALHGTRCVDSPIPSPRAPAAVFCFAPTAARHSAPDGSALSKTSRISMLGFEREYNSFKKRLQDFVEIRVVYGFLSSGYTFEFCFGWPQVRASRPLPRCLMRARLVSRLRCTRSTATSARRRSRSSPSRRRRARPPEARAPTRVTVLVPHGRGGAGWPTLALCCAVLYPLCEENPTIFPQTAGGRQIRACARGDGRGSARERERERQRETERGR